MNKTALRENLGGFYGTEAYHRLNPFPAFATDGVAFLAQNADAFWLLNEIAGAQTEPVIRRDRRLQEIQFWTLRKNPEQPQPAPFTLGAVLASQQPKSGMATLVCERDSNDIAFTKEIEFTDFPFDAMPKNEVRIWVQPTVIDGKHVKVLMLPSEY